jgi:hypothetical protein
MTAAADGASEFDAAAPTANGTVEHERTERVGERVRSTPDIGVVPDDADD